MRFTAVGPSQVPVRPPLRPACGETRVTSSTVCLRKPLLFNTEVDVYSACRRLAAAGRRTAQNAFLLVAPIMNAWCAIQFGVTHFRSVCRVCYRVFTASPPMRPSKADPLDGDGFGSLLSRC